MFGGKTRCDRRWKLECSIAAHYSTQIGSQVRSWPTEEGLGRRWRPTTGRQQGSQSILGMNANQLDRAAYQAAHAILSSLGSRALERPIDEIAETIKSVFEPLCSADCAVTRAAVGNIFHAAVDSAVPNTGS